MSASVVFKPNMPKVSAIALLFATVFVASQSRIQAQTPPPALQLAQPQHGTAAAAQSGDRTLSEWLMRLHAASAKNRAYVGTFVVSSGSNMSSARIWHVCEGDQQMERVENLTGAPRSTFRHNTQVVTFLPEAKVARTEKRESLGLFPELLKGNAGSIPEFYQARAVGAERVAGFDAEVMQLQPRDALRFGYRVWTEKKTSLVVKLQTLDASGHVMEQAAFSELQLDAPVRMDKLAQMMASTEGYRVESSEQLVKTTAQAEGWVLRSAVPGFAPMSCYKRSLPLPAVNGVPATSVTPATMQWIFSDGLATVSLFVEPFDRQRHLQEAVAAVGATQTLTRKLDDPAGGREWWLTAVGEVPVGTLKAFAAALERKK